MTVDRKTYKTGEGSHAYDVECYKGAAYRRSEAIRFEVDAANRNQAARRCERDGWEVASVNMVA